MAATLQGLPTELLLQIIGTQSNQGFPEWKSPEVALPSKRQRLFATLRASCLELNAKLSYFFTTKYLAKIRIALDEANVSRLRAMSENPVHPHVRSIVIDVGSLFHYTFFDDAWGSSDDSEYSWSSSVASEVLDAQCYKYGMDEYVATFIANGTCGRLLRATLLNFPNLRSIQIVPPSVCGTMAERKWLAIESRWIMASRVLLNVVFTSVPLLEELLVIGGVNSHPMPLPLSSLDLVAMYSPGWLSSLQKLHLWLGKGNDLHEVAFTMSVQMLTLLLQKLTHLIDLRLSLGGTPESYFRLLAINLPPLQLQRLDLCRITTRYRHLATFLRLCSGTLRSFKLSLSILSKYRHIYSLLQLLIHELKLEECVLMMLNVEDRGLRWGRVAKMQAFPHPEYCRPGETEGFGWELVDTSSWNEHELTLRADEGDDIPYWLRMVHDHAELGDKWAFIEMGLEW